MVGIISSVVLTIVVISFGSVVIALRCICSIAYTVIFVSGLAEIVYCNDAFGSSFYGFRGNGALVWLVPPTIFPLLVGLALDYDIFLVWRSPHCPSSRVFFVMNAREGLGEMWK
jgi:uncharacterized membrane protein YdfJ with MMPL/SSD domain